MFHSIKYIRYRHRLEHNVFLLRDTCFSDYINSPSGSPPLENYPNNKSNTLTLLSIAKFYESKNRNVALNLAYYYYWLHLEGYGVNKSFIEKQLLLIDQVMPQLKFTKKYFNNICQYLKSRNLLYID